MSEFGFLFNIIFLAVGITYIVKYYKYKDMAEKAFIDYESRLSDELSTRKEEEYIHESEMHLYKEEHGELTPEIEGEKIEKKKLRAQLSRADGGGIDMEKMLTNLDNLYQEKEVERERRFEAEKNLALALQHSKNIEHQAEDYKAIQNHNIHALKKVAGSLYKKINGDLQRYLR
jgi:hypothetical protein